MAVLYDRSVTWRGLVVGTGNKTESLIGYTTLFGDSACAFNPIGDLYKSQVRQLAAAIGVPEAIIRKAPSADLWPGQTDEVGGGLHVPGARPAAVLADRQAALGRRGGREGVRAGAGRAGRPDGRGRRVQAPGAADREARPADGRRRLPLPAAPAGLGARRARWRDGRDAVRRRDADRQPRRRHAAGPRGPARGPAGRGRGHADHPPAARPLRDHDPDGELPRAERARPASGSSWTTSRPARTSRS